MTKNRLLPYVIALPFSLLMLALSVPQTAAQAPGVEIVSDRGEQRKMLVEQANELLAEGKLLSLEEAVTQLDRESCRIDLPKPRKRKLSVRKIWERSRDARVRVGWHHLCTRCDHWHLNLAGGYFINNEGAVATCHHVIAKDKDAFREGYLVAANDRGELFPVIEILASNEGTDTAIVRVETDGPVTALPLNVNVYPGDAVWCYSDPLGRSGYFSEGIVNRFYLSKRKDGQESPRIEVSTDWAQGSSGAAVLDQYGNAIGHVSTISAAGTRRKKRVTRHGDDSTNKTVKVSMDKSSPVIVFHCAARAADVLALVESGPAKD